MDGREVRRYLSRERDLDVLLPVLLLLLLLSLLEDLECDLPFLTTFAAPDEPFEGCEAFFGVSDAGLFFLVLCPLLEALLLREELPEELLRLDPEELERDPELERLELLDPDEELGKRYISN